jgi:5-methylcytosine-specific restriction protein A
VVGEPYQEDQPDKNGNMRKVWMFPVKMVKDVEMAEAEAEAEADEKLLEALEHLSERDYSIPDFEYVVTPQEKAPPIIRDHIKIRTRNPAHAVVALRYADFLCEIDGEHPSFIRRKNNHNYVEPHHLVPMKYSDDFDVSLDVPANIVSLCSNCHNEIHYGRDYEQLVEKLYEKRKGLLQKAGINITLEQLKRMYP